MLTATRRRVAGAAIASSALLALLAAPGTAHAAAPVTWRTTVIDTVHTQHCSAELIAHVGSNGKYDASGEMTVHSVTSSLQIAGHGDCDYQVVVNGTPSFRPDIGFSYWSSASRTYTSGWVSDPVGSTVQVCLAENYYAPHHANYHAYPCTKRW